jgi:hypothetical protein
MIARTEVNIADRVGNIQGWAESGVVKGRRWIADANCCPECAALNGTVVGLDECFDGEDFPGEGIHPNDRCTETAEVMTQDEIDAATEGDQ